MKNVLLIVLFVFCSYSVFAQPLTLELFDASTKESLRDGVLVVSLNNQEEYIEFVEDGMFSFDISDDDLVANIIFDRVDTEAIDYYGTMRVGGTKRSAFLFPVGSVQGMVLDDTDNLLPDVPLVFSCTENYGKKNPTTTDEFGSFENTMHSPGTCTVKVQSDGKTGVAQVEITQGRLSEVVVHVGGQQNRMSPLVIIIVGFFILIVIVLMRKKGKKESGTWLDDVKKTLSEKENKIVRFLLDHTNKSTQSTLRHELAIPNTSLSRILQSLEKKDIISVESHGKFRKIMLKEWFVKKSK